MDVLADVLDMAKTEEKRNLIKWYFFFFMCDWKRGLELARQYDNQDARFLVSLFPDGPPADCTAAVSAFQLQDDPRCLCWHL